MFSENGTPFPLSFLINLFWILQDEIAKLKLIFFPDVDRTITSDRRLDFHCCTASIVSDGAKLVTDPMEALFGRKTRGADYRSRTLVSYGYSRVSMLRKVSWTLCEPLVSNHAAGMRILVVTIDVYIITKDRREQALVYTFNTSVLAIV